MDIILYKRLDENSNLLFNIKHHYFIIAFDENSLIHTKLW